jgi:hypothetical protein
MKTPIEFLQEIQAWLCFNNSPSKEQIGQLKSDLDKQLKEYSQLQTKDKNKGFDIDGLRKHLENTPIEVLQKEWADVAKEFPSPTLPTTQVSELIEKYESKDVIAFGNFVRDNYHGIGTPKMISYDQTKYPHGTIEDIFKIWKNLKTLNK